MMLKSKKWLAVCKTNIFPLASCPLVLAAWKKAAENQGKLLGSLQAKVDEVNAARREIQLAADTCWPSSDTTNGPLRHAFKIPANKPIAK